MKTREKILATSLSLFNSHGLANVSQRKITDVLSISPGNLTYHFRKKEDIEEALYFQLVEKIDQSQQELTHELGLSSVGAFIDTLFSLFYEYRFIFLDYVYLMKTNPKISSHYKKLLITRKQQFITILRQLEAEKIIRPENLPNEYDYLYKRIQIVTDFYFSATEVSEGGVKREHISTYRSTILYALYPLITDKGTKDFMKLISKV